MTQGEKVVTDVGAVAALASPYWLPILQEISEVAGLIVPILGAVWLIIQISHYLYRIHKKNGAS
jgi:membrane protein YdbS with pleckstrin-like domain